MTTTSIDLGNHFTEFVNDLKQSGRYQNNSDAIKAGLRLLEKQEAEYQAKLDAMREAITEGEQSGESEYVHEEIIAMAKAELDVS